MIRSFNGAVQKYPWLYVAVCVLILNLMMLSTDGLLSGILFLFVPVAIYVLFAPQYRDDDREVARLLRELDGFAQGGVIR